MNLKMIAVLLATTMAGSVCAADAAFPVKGKMHSAMECAACHKTSTPVKNAPQSSCRGCHGDMKNAKQVLFTEAAGRQLKLNVHDTHAGDLRCTSCHKVHKESKLYCNEACHHKFQNKTP